MSDKNGIDFRGLLFAVIIISLIFFGYYFSQIINIPQKDFHQIVKEGHLNEIKTIISDVKDINIKGENDLTALMIALKNENEDVVKILLKNSADVNIKGPSNRTSLMFGVETGNENIIKLLLDENANVNSIDNRGYNALFYFNIRKNFKSNLNILEQLIKNNININQKANNGDTPLINLAKKGSPNLIKKILTFDPRVNETNNNNETALSIAINNVSYNSAEHLINSGAEVNFKPDVGNNILMIALNNNHVPASIIKSIISNGIELNKSNSKSILSLAANHKNPTIFQELVKANISLNYEKEYLNQILINLIKTNSGIKSIDYILKEDLDLNIRDDEGKTLLMHASKNNDHHEVIKRLIDAGIDINTRDISGNTALTYSINSNNYQAFSTLIENGADPHYYLNMMGNSLNFAIMQGAQIRIIKDLLNLNVDPNRKGFKSVTPLGWLVNSEYYSSSSKSILTTKLIEAGANVNVKDSLGLPVVFSALKNELSTKAIIDIFDSGVHVNTEIPSLNQTLLMQAAFYAKEPLVINYLLDNGADPKIKDIKGRTALDYASKNKNIKDTNIYWRLNDAIN
jgi:serine/threonine-protein phosphatase 6 regulatory ankyrin repeat subunit B